MKKTFIVGSGGLGLEILELLIQINNNNKKIYDFKGFIDSNNIKEVKYLNKRIKVYDESKFILKNSLNSDISIIIGIGTPYLIHKISNNFLKNTNFQFPNMIHPNCQISESSILNGKGNVIMSNTVLSTNSIIGSFNIINLNCTIGHDVKIKDNNVINPGSNISGNVTIGNCNLIGTNSSIIQGTIIGDNNLISAASLISKDIENNFQLMGNPARVIGKTK